MRKNLLVEVESVVDLGAVLENNGKNTANVVGLIVPVAGCNLNGDFLTVVRLEPIVLACAGGIEAKLGVTVYDVDVGIVLCVNNLNANGYNVNLGGVAFGSVESCDVSESLVGDELLGGVLVAAVVVSYDNGVNDSILTVGGVGVVLNETLSHTGDYDLVTDCDSLECILGGKENCDHRAVLTEEVEAVSVYERGTYDTLNGNVGVEGCKLAIIALISSTVLPCVLARASISFSSVGTNS